MDAERFLLAICTKPRNNVCWRTSPDDVLLAPSSQDLQNALGHFSAECEVAWMSVSTSKSEAMVLDRKKVVCTLQVGGEFLPQVEGFKDLGVLFTSEGSMDREIDRWIGAAAAVMPSVVVKKELSRKAKLSIYQSIYVRTLIYDQELGVMTRKNKIPDTSSRNELPPYYALHNLHTKLMLMLHSNGSILYCDLKKYGATTLVRVCEVTYDKTPLEKDGITVVDWPFDDGAPPPSKVVEDWLSLLRRRFMEEPGCCVAVHCVAGLGRAPVLVALALIECGMKYEDAIQFIRQKRRGAINSKQLTYLEKYRPKQRLRYKHSHIFKSKCCIM
ncbi:hypothetical protein QTP86_025334 [Hemibagrus guttatus]|nr:hypothetical protein QTP86_025334 [Hemibagrus guttatus]